MPPIRSKQQREVAQNPWDRSVRELGQQDETHVLGDDGGIESYRTTVHRPCACGCLRPPGGYCIRCGSLVCVTCFYHCALCGKPLCPRHTVFEESTTGQKRQLCEPCSDAVTRRRRAVGLGKLLLSPFIDFGDKR